MSTNGCLGWEAKAVLRAIATKLSDKWQQPSSTVRSHLGARLSIYLI